MRSGSGLLATRRCGIGMGMSRRRWSALGSSLLRRRSCQLAPRRSRLGGGLVGRRRESGSGGWAEVSMMMRAPRRCLWRTRRRCTRTTRRMGRLTNCLPQSKPISTARAISRRLWNLRGARPMSDAVLAQLSAMHRTRLTTASERVAGTRPLPRGRQPMPPGGRFRSASIVAFQESVETSASERAAACGMTRQCMRHGATFLEDMQSIPLVNDRWAVRSQYLYSLTGPAVSSYNSS